MPLALYVLVEKVFIEGRAGAIDTAARTKLYDAVGHRLHQLVVV
jgi:hypothetical protein